MEGRGFKDRERHWPGTLRVAHCTCLEVANYIAEGMMPWKNRACGCHPGAWHTAVMVGCLQNNPLLAVFPAPSFYKESDLLKTTKR